MINVVVKSPMITSEYLSICFMKKKIFFQHLKLSVEIFEKREVFANIQTDPACVVPNSDSVIPHRLSLHLLPINTIPVTSWCLSFTNVLSVEPVFCVGSYHWPSSLCRALGLVFGDGRVESCQLCPCRVSNLTVHRGTVRTHNYSESERNCEI